MDFGRGTGGHGGYDHTGHRQRRVVKRSEETVAMALSSIFS